MEKTFNVTFTAEQLSVIITALHMEMSREEYDDDIRSQLADAFVACLAFKVK